VRRRFIDAIVTALLACVSGPSMLRDGDDDRARQRDVRIQARRSNPRRDRKTGDSSVA
jgi:hypothetical protein